MRVLCLGITSMSEEAYWVYCRPRVGLLCPVFACVGAQRPRIETGCSGSLWLGGWTQVASAKGLSQCTRWVLAVLP